jgi:hypothetical protein
MRVSPVFCFSRGERDALVVGYLPDRHVTYIADLSGDRTGVGVLSKRINDLSSVSIFMARRRSGARSRARFHRAALFIPSRAGVTGSESTHPATTAAPTFEIMGFGSAEPSLTRARSGVSDMALSPSSRWPSPTSRAHGRLKEFA